MADSIAVYPGTFDPVTNGHLDVIERGARLFPKLIVASAVNTAKAPLFSEAERLELLRAEVARFPNVEVDSFTGLAVDYAKRRGARVLLRGIRTLSDFEYEFQMALTNRTLAADIETIFVMSAVEWSYTSSRLLKEAAIMGADVSHFLPARVNEAMRRKVCTTRA